MSNEVLKQNRESVKWLFILHIMLMLYSLGSVCSKKASNEIFLSPMFCIFYGVTLSLIFLYAIGWQQVIKRLDLTIAYANKAVTVIWGMIWGYLFFDEKMSINKLVGSLLVIAGIIIYAKSDKKEE